MIAEKSKRRKRLILLRHAKSAWPEGVDDHDRPLSDRGKKAAPVVGVYLEKNKLTPDLALLSSARRAQETWARASRAIKGDVAVRTMREIYAADPDRILDAIRGVDSGVRTLLVVGHNPGLEDLAKLLMKDAGGEAAMRLREKFPTAGVAVLSFEIQDWKDITVRTGSLDKFVTPKSLAES